MKQFLIILFCSVIAVNVIAQNTLDKVGLTSSTPAAVAYSLRLLSSSYAGKAINVRRSSDNATQDIGFNASGNLDTAALAAFVTTNNGFVTIWYDQSGNARNMVKSSASVQPQIVFSGAFKHIGTKVTIDFKSDKGLVYPSPVTLYSISTVIKSESTVFPGFHAILDGDRSPRIGGILTNGGTNFWEDAPQLAIWRDGISLAVTASLSPVNEGIVLSYSSQTTQANQLCIGNYDAGGSGGSILESEAIGFPALNSNAERQTLVFSQGNYYDISEPVLNSLSVSAASAYSLRLLSSSYTGQAINVRRSNDNATQDIGFTASGNLDTAALKTFVGSNSAYVATWYDQSGNTRNLTQATVAQQPTLVNAGVIYRKNSMPTTYYDASNDGMGYGTNYLTSTPISVNIVAGSNSSSSSFRRAVQGTQNWLIGPYSNQHAWYAGGWNHQIASPWSTTAVEIFTVIEPSSNANSSWRNAASQTSANNKGLPNVINTGTVGTGYQPLDGFISEIVSFNAELSTSDRNNLEISQGIYYSVSLASAPIILTQPSSSAQSLNVGASATALSVSASGNSLTYQWYSNSSNSNSSGTLISGANNASYTPSTAVAGTLYYYVIISSTGGFTSTSNISGAIVVTLASPTISGFSNLTKTYYDGSFTISPPTSTNSTGAFTYSSSNTAVATISGTTVTIVAAGTTTITATEAADATYSSGTITATLTVNSVTIITKNGQITSSGSAYINKNGAIGGSYGVNKYGQILATKTAGNGLTAATASTSAYAIKQAYPSSTDGYYWIANANINGGAAFQIYADMTTNGGGWTLILQNAYSNSSWTYANSVLLNQTSPKYTSNNSGLDVSYDYSIISWADYIKSSSSGFQYMIDSYQRGQYGGIFTANAAYSFVSTTNANSNITNNQWFSGLGYNNNNGIGPRMPWWVNSQGYITTSDTGTGSWWGSLVAGESGWNPSPLLSNHNPSYIIWYWVR